jgi:MoaA/NifB/PqqE/SkfB family radical SAM enzyme
MPVSSLHKEFEKAKAASASYFRWPYSVFVDTVSVCNARCPFCPLFQGDDKMTRDIHPAGSMDIGLFQSVYDQITAFETRPSVIYIGLHGEPLMDKFLAERLRIIGASPLAGVTDILTNAQFLDEKKSRMCLEAKVARLTIGFDGATKAVYERHRVRCDFERVVSNIKRFVELRREYGGGTRIAVQYVRTSENEHEVADAYELFGEFLDPELDYFQDNFAKDWASPPLHAGDLVRLKISAGARKAATCVRAESELIILVDGKIGVCSWDYNLDISGEPLGDATKRPLIEIWHDSSRQSVLTAMRGPQIADAPERCRSCVFLHEHTDLPVVNSAIADLSRVEANPFALIYRFAPRA